MFERGDLLLVPFPFTDLSAAKRRPVLAVTAADNYGDRDSRDVAFASRARPATRSSGYAERNAAGGKLDSYQSHRHAQRQSGGQNGWTYFRTSRGGRRGAVLRVHWLS
jgi:hypothetical protein